MLERRSAKRSMVRWQNVIIIAAIFLGVTIFSLFHNSNPTELAFYDDYLTITGPDDAPFVVTVQYQDILSVSESNELEPGICLNGLDTERCRFGSWQNDVYGDYTLCVSPAFSEHIALGTKKGIVAFNCESADSTHHLYLALVDLLRDHGLEV